MSAAGYSLATGDRVEEPELWPDLELIYKAFQILHSHRPQGFSGPQPISLQEMEAYCRVYSYPGPLDELAYFVRRMDATLVEALDEERQRREKIERSKVR